LVSAVSILGFTGSEKLVAVGIGLSAIMVGSSAYLLRNAERLAGEYALIGTG
jgi:ABC-type enterobactin transport system permease subunit